MGFILRSNSRGTWPPLVPVCPDWWIADGSGNNSTCINVKDLGVCPAQSGEKQQKIEEELEEKLKEEELKQEQLKEDLNEAAGLPEVCDTD